MHASDDSPCHSSAKPPPLEGSAPSHGAFQGHAAHLAEWSATLRPTGSSSTCIPEGVSTFFHAAFTAHSEARADAVCRRLQLVVSPCVNTVHLAQPSITFSFLHSLGVSPDDCLCVVHELPPVWRHRILVNERF